ncbi:hypothetical protein NL64_26920 [Pseudomonas fluorescens]|nr:hypothetical protein [Pseudomonas fluorescens]KII27577.1 hypothetical protein NL64_26920 [Pseudomonas fluorescens]
MLLADYCLWYSPSSKSGSAFRRTADYLDYVVFEQVVRTAINDTAFHQAIRTILSDAIMNQTIRATFCKATLTHTVGATFSDTIFNQ